MTQTHFTLMEQETKATTTSIKTESQYLSIETLRIENATPKNMPILSAAYVKIRSIRFRFAKEWVTEEPFIGRCFWLNVPKKLMTCSKDPDERVRRKQKRSGSDGSADRGTSETQEAWRAAPGWWGATMWGGNKGASSLKPFFTDPATAEPGMPTLRPRTWAHLAWPTCASAHTPH